MRVQPHLLFQVFQYEVTRALVGTNFSALHTNFQLTLQLALTFTATADSPYLGENLGIRLVNILQGRGLLVNFDNVRLSAAVLPDISTTVM